MRTRSGCMVWGFPLFATGRTASGDHIILAVAGRVTSAWVIQVATAGKVFEEWCHQGQLSLRNVMCTCGKSLWHSDKPRGLSRCKGGQQEPAFPQQGCSRRERMEVRQQAQGDVEREKSFHISLDFGSIRVDSGSFALWWGPGGCLVIWGGGKGTSLALVVGLAGPFRCFRLHSVLLGSGLVSASLWCWGRGWSRPFCSNQFSSALA